MENVSDPDLKKTYQVPIGSLIYAIIKTRPDLASKVFQVSSFAANPKVV